MIRLLHLADVHLGAPLPGFREAAGTRRAAILGAFRELPERTADAALDAVLVAGDLFHSPRPDAELLAVVRDTFRRFVERERPVFVIPGNHDAAGSGGPWDALPAGVHVFRQPRFGETGRVDTEAGTLWVHGVAFDPAEEPDPLSTWRPPGRPGVHAVLLHAGLRGSPRWEAGRSLRVEESELLALGADYIALGDYHDFRPPDAFGDAAVPACYPGSFAAVDLTERGPHGWVVAEVGKGTPPRVELHSSGVPALHDVGAVDVGGCEDERQVASKVAARAPEDSWPVGTLTGEPSFPLDPEAVEVELRARFGFASLDDRTRYYDSARVRELAGRNTIAGHVARLGLRRIGEASDPGERELHERALRAALRALEADG